MHTDVKGRAAADPQHTPPGLQPFLHDSCVVLAAPAVAVSGPDGQIRHGVDGFYHGDRRFLSRLEVRAEGVPLAPVHGGFTGADTAAFRAVLRGLGEHTPDPAVTVHRRRRLTGNTLRETLDLHNAGRDTVEFALTVSVAADFAAMEDVKSGRAGHAPEATAWTAAADGLVRHDGGLHSRLRCAPAADTVEADRGLLHFTVRLAPGARQTLTLLCEAEDEDGFPFLLGHTAPAPWGTPRLRTGEPRLHRLFTQSLADLDGFLLADPEQPRDRFVAAGAPWFLTLFGRDSLWAARMLLPLGTELAAGTLRTLARRQGRRRNPATEEQPGKILHEIRRAPLRLHTGNALPPEYYGTVDATPLWLTLLYETWRWGHDESEIEALLPAAEAALTWLVEHGDADGDGFLEYVDSTGTGLSNQGWKDSVDAIRWRDGTLATAPVALSEVQGYAYQAARGGAALLRAFDRPGADRFEEWAERLRTRFRKHFWLADDQGPYCAVALDGAKRAVDTVTSNMGHLLGTGLLDPEESAHLARRLSAPQLDCGFGLRTLSSASTGFNPLGYHIGSVWPHDTAITAHGLARAGFPDEAVSLLDGLLTASDAFAGRLPELFAGHGSDEDVRPAAYPAACRPQAWAAASAVLLVGTVLGLDADVPGGRLRVAARVPEAWRPWRVEGLRVAGAELAVSVDVDGRVTARTDAPVEVVTD